MSSVSFLEIASRSSIYNFSRILSSLKTWYVAMIRACAEVSIPAISWSSVFAVRSSIEGLACAFSVLGLSAVSKIVGRWFVDVVDRACNASMRSRATY